MEYGQLSRSMWDRMKGAALLRREVYADLAADAGAMGQAAGVVGLAAVAAAIGGITGGAVGFVGGLVSAYVGWLAWAGVSYLIGDKLLGGTATWSQLLRTLGFAQTPAILFIVLIIPGIGIPFAAVISLWALFAALIALREALGFSFGRAILTAVLGWIAFVILRFVGLGLPGVGA